MDKSMIKGLAIGGIAMVVLGAGAVTGFKAITKPSQAEVVAVKDVMETVVTPKEHCENVAVKHQAPVQDERRIAKGELAPILKAKQAKNPEQPVVISADKSVRYEAVLEVMDELQKQSVKRVGLSVKPAR